MLSAHLKLIDTRESYFFGHPSMKWPDTKFPLLFWGLYCWLYSTLLPEPWAADEGPRWRASREFHPSEDLSELSPLFVAVAGQEYHDRLTGSSRFEIPTSSAENESYARCLTWPSFYGEHAPQAGPGAFSASLSLPQSPVN